MLCPQCGVRTLPVSVVQEVEVIDRILRHLWQVGGNDPLRGTTLRGPPAASSGLRTKAPRRSRKSAKVVVDLRDFAPRAGEKCPGRVTVEGETEADGVRTGEDGAVRDRRATCDGGGVGKWRL
jgi:hypothetical protein